MLQMRNFNAWLSKMRDSINGYDYYVDYEKVYANVNAMKVELNILNSLIGSKNIEEEGKNILSKIADDEFVITLEIKGKAIDSVELAKLIDEKLTYGMSKITFVIGGSNGLSERVSKRSDYHLSFSKFTFPHQLMRLILTEQIYRALTIIKNKEYHK